MTYILLIITFLTASFQEDKLFKKQLKGRPKAILFLLVSATIISFAKEYNVSVEKNIEEQFMSVNNQWGKQERGYYENLRLSSNTRRILEGIGVALAKYKLAYDTANKKIESLKQLIRDSANRKITIMEAESPLVSFTIEDGIRLDYKRNDTLRYLVSITSYSAPSIVNNATLYVMLSKNNIGGIFKDLAFNQKTLFANHILRLPKDKPLERGFNIFGKAVNHVKSVIILLKGTLADSKEKSNNNFEEVGFLNVDTKSFSKMVSPYDDSLRAYLKKIKVL